MADIKRLSGPEKPEVILADFDVTELSIVMVFEYEGRTYAMVENTPKVGVSSEQYTIFEREPLDGERYEYQYIPVVDEPRFTDICNAVEQWRYTG